MIDKEMILKRIGLIKDADTRDLMEEFIDNNMYNSARMYIEDLVDTFPNNELYRELDTMIMDYYFE